MSPTDIADVTGATYTYLLNGSAPAGNWTGLFRPGERVRLRFIGRADPADGRASVPQARPDEDMKQMPMPGGRPMNSD